MLLLLPLAPIERAALPLLLTVELLLWLGEGVAWGVPVAEGVALPVGVPLLVTLAVALPLRLWLLLVEALAPLLREPVGDPESVEEALTVLEGVDAALPVALLL